MPFCPSCGAEYRPRFATCADCRVALVDAPPQGAPARARLHEADVPVARAPNQPLAQMWAELLGQHGIACRLAPLSVADSVYVPSQGAVELRVRAIDAARARALLPDEAHLAVAAVDPSESEPPVPDDPVTRRLRWLVLVGLALVVLLLLAWAIRTSAANGYL
jgi:hypothetical protein